MANAGAWSNIVVGNNVLKFPAKKSSSGTYHKVGEEQEVYPFKDENDINNICDFLKSGGCGNQFAMRNYTLFMVGINTALRCGDLIKLTWEKLYNANSDSINASIKVLEEKTQDTRSQREYRNIELNDNAIDVLESLYLYEYEKLGCSPTGYVFRGQRGNSHIGVDAVRKILKEAAFACGITFNVGTHSMRKTFGYHFVKTLSADGNYNAIYQLQDLLGHSDIKVTKRYIGLEKEFHRDLYQRVKLGH